jgi:hypothetical protein
MGIGTTEGTDDCMDAGGRQKTAPAFSAFATSLWFSNVGAVADDCMDAGGRAPTVGALGDAGAVAENTEFILIVSVFFVSSVVNKKFINDESRRIKRC